jgi:hypothetical protein
VQILFTSLGGQFLLKYISRILGRLNLNLGIF